MECKNFLSLFKRLLQEWADKDKSLEMPLQEWLEKDKKYKEGEKDKNESSKTPLSAISEPSSSKQEQEMLVFDFDTIMKNFCTKINILTLSSVDGLYLDDQRNIIYLLEIKSIASHLERSQESTTMSPEEKFKSIKGFLLEGEDDLSDDGLLKDGEKKKKKKSTLADKAGNTYTSFFAMFGFGYSDEEESLRSSGNVTVVRHLLDKKQFAIKYYIVVDMGSRDYTRHRVSLLSSLKPKIAHGFLSDIDLIRSVDTHKILLGIDN